MNKNTEKLELETLDKLDNNILILIKSLWPEISEKLFIEYHIIKSEITKWENIHTYLCLQKIDIQINKLINFWFNSKQLLDFYQLKSNITTLHVKKCWDITNVIKTQIKEVIYL